MIGFFEKGNRRAVSASVMLVLFMGFFCSVTLFPHTHIVNGVTITHSHPYSGNPDDPNHTHTSTEIAAIAQMATLIAVVSVFVFGFAVNRPRLFITAGAPQESTLRGYVPASPLRGPPAF